MRWAAACGDALARELGGDPPNATLDHLAAELVAAPASEAAARFWGALLRAGLEHLGDDDRYRVTIWQFERSLVGLPTGEALCVLAYATATSDALWPTETYATVTLSTAQGAPPHPEFRFSQTPTQALDALRRSVPEAALWAALREEWTPWLLGLADPVLARAKATPERPQAYGVGTTSFGG